MSIGHGDARRLPCLLALAAAVACAAGPAATVDALKEEETGIARQLAADFPNSVDALAVAGMLYGVLGNSGEAAKYWERALALDPGFAEAQMQLGWNALKQGDYERAAALFRKALEASPRLPGAHHRLACALMFLGRTADAIVELQKEIAISPRAADSHYLLGQAHLELKQYEVAEKSFETALAIHPGQRNACYGLATVCARLGDAERARQYREEFAKLEREDLRSLIDGSKAFNDLAAMQRSLAEAHSSAGEVYFKHSRQREAETHARRAAELDPKNAACRALLAMIYQASHREQDALEMHEQIAEIQPDNATNWFNIGILNARLKRPGPAEKAFRKAIEIAPQSAPAYAALAVLFLQTHRDLAEARTLAESAAKLAPNVQNYLLLSRLCDVNGDRLGAVSAMKRVVELDPGNHEYKRMLRQLQGGQ